MSESIDRIIGDALNQRPAALRAYQHDSALHLQVEVARRLLGVAELAMQREGIPRDSAERVLNETMHVGLDDWEREKLSRERDLLLTRFDPSEFGRPSSPVFTEPSPGARPVRPGEEPTT